MRTQSRYQGRFDSKVDTAALYGMVTTVCRVARSSDPKSVRQTEFDRARASAGHPDAPTARAICMRLNVSWRALLEQLFTPGTSTRQLESQRTRSPERKLTNRIVRFALRSVALELGAETISNTEYARGRERLVKADVSRWRRAPAQEGVPAEVSLPTEGQILIFAGTWANALTIAGLPALTITRKQGVEIVDALGLFAGALGTLPDELLLRRFAKVNGFALAKRQVGRPWAEYLDEYRALAAARGLPATTELEHEKGQPLPVLPEDVRAGLPSANRKRWDWEGCVAGVQRYDREHAGTTTRSLRHYRDWSIGKPDVPSMSTIIRFGWSRVLAEAQKRNRTEKKAA